MTSRVDDKPINTKLWDGLCATEPAAMVVFQDDASLNSAKKAWCKKCPLIADCLEWVMEHEEDGVWGGTTPQQRVWLRRQRRLGSAA